MENKYIIFMADDICRLMTVCDEKISLRHIAIGHESSLDIQIGTIIESLGECGYLGEPVLLGIDSSWCLCAHISTDDIERSGRRRAMGFRMEEHLPISAEDVVTDYVELSNNAAFGVSCEFEKLDAIIKAFSQQGVAVQNIVPAALLEAEYIAGNNPNADGVLIVSENGEQEEKSYDLIELDNSRASNWWWFSSSKGNLISRLELWAEAHDYKPSLVVIGCDESIVHDADIIDKIEFIDSKVADSRKACSDLAARIVDQQAIPWIDLRCGKLKAPNAAAIYNKPLRALVFSIVLLFICLAGVMYWRGTQYESLSKVYRSKQVEVFKKTFPSQRIPGNVAGRLASEQRRLAGLGGENSAGDMMQSIKNRDAFTHFQAILKSLPVDMRYRILSMNIGSDVIMVNGQAQSHIEAERIFLPLGKGGGYDVQQPKTRALKNGGVDFLLTVKPATQGV